MERGMMLFFHVLHVCLLISFCSGQSLFQNCDTDRDKKWSKDEFISCFQSQIVVDETYGLGLLFDNIDENADGYVSAAEYNSSQEKLFKPKSHSGVDEEMITVTDRNGIQKQMKMSSIYKSMDNNMKGFSRTEDNKLVKEEEKTSSTTELSKSDPEAARIVRIGNWTYHSLKKFGIVSGKLKGIVSTGSKHRPKHLQDLEFPSYCSNHASLFNITLRVWERFAERKVEVQVVHDPVALESPSLFLSKIYAGISTEQRNISLPAPPLRDWKRVYTAIYKKHLSFLFDNIVFLVIFSGTLVGVFLLLLIFYCSDDRRKEDEMDIRQKDD